MFFYSLSARFKPWYHSWPYVPESTTINPCLKIVIFYRTSPELLTFLVASNLKGRCSFPDHISKICFRYDNVCANIRGHNNCRRCLERYQQFSFQNELKIKFQMRLTHRMTVLCFLHSMAYVIPHHAQFLQMLTGDRRQLSRAT